MPCACFAFTTAPGMTAESWLIQACWNFIAGSPALENRG